MWHWWDVIIVSETRIWAGWSFSKKYIYACKIPKMVLKTGTVMGRNHSIRNWNINKIIFECSHWDNIDMGIMSMSSERTYMPSRTKNEVLLISYVLLAFYSKTQNHPYAICSAFFCFSRKSRRKSQGLQKFLIEKSPLWRAHLTVPEIGFLSWPYKLSHGIGN